MKEAHKQKVNGYLDKVQKMFENEDWIDQIVREEDTSNWYNFRIEDNLGKTWIVRCKPYLEAKLAASDLEEFTNHLEENGLTADQAIYVCSDFSSTCIGAAEQMGIKLMTVLLPKKSYL